MSLELANVEDIYKKDDRLKKDDIQTIFRWLKSQPHLPDLTELQVIIFLHSCYYDTEMAQTTIVNYFTVKTNSDLFQSAGEDVITRNLKKILTVIVPKRTPDGCCVMLFRLLDPRPEAYSCMEHTKLVIMVIILHCHQYGPAKGLLIVCDTQFSSFAHLFRVNVSVIRQLMYFLQEATPVRLRGINFINAVPVTKHFIALARPFMKREIYDMIKFHPHLESLHESVPKECLPEEYGGELPSFQHLNDENIRNVLNNSDFFKWHDLQKMTGNVVKRGGIFSTVRGIFR